MKSEHRTLCATAKSRKQLVDRCRTLATELNLNFTTHDNALTPRGQTVEFALGPYIVFAQFNGASKVDAFLGHWHIERGAAPYPVTFGADIRGTVNPYHHCKATTCSDSFEGFLQSIRRGFEALREEGLIQ